MGVSKRFARLAATPLEATIPADALKATLAEQPFVSFPGSFNLRDVGTFAPGYVKPRTVFRSGMTDYIPEASQPALRSELGLARIYDFRRTSEVKVRLRPVEGIQMVACVSHAWETAPPSFEPLAYVVKDGDVTSQGWKDLYESILKSYAEGYKQTFEALKTAREGEAVLYHCTGEIPPQDVGLATVISNEILKLARTALGL
jgi:hypothetical protein